MEEKHCDSLKTFFTLQNGKNGAPGFQKITEQQKKSGLFSR